MKRILHVCGLGIILLFIFLYPGPNGAAVTEDEKLEAYLRVFPGAKSIGVIYSAAEKDEAIKKLEESARKKGITLNKVRIPSLKEFPKACQQVQGQVDTMWVVDDPLFALQDAWSYFILFTMRNKIKTVVYSEKTLSAGGLFLYTENKEIVINKKILDVLGLKVPEGVQGLKYLGAEVQ